MNPVGLKPGWTYDDFSRDGFITSYLESAVRSYPFNPNTFTPADLAMSAVERMVEDCQSFKESNTSDIIAGDPPAQPDTVWKIAGRVFWRVRNDPRRRFPMFTWRQPYEERLTQAARAFGPCRLFVGHNGLVYVHTEVQP